MRLQNKIHLYTSVVFAILLLAATATIYFVFSSTSIKSELNQLKNEMRYAASDVQLRTEKNEIEELLRAYVPLNGMIAYVKEQSGAAIIVTSGSQLQLGNEQLQFSSTEKLEMKKTGGQSYSFVSIPFISASGEIVNLHAMASLNELHGFLRMLRIVLLIVATCVMIPAVISSRILGRVIMQPITAMIKTMKEVSRSGSFLKLEQAEQSKDELRDMGEAFNDMISLLESNYTRQEQFVANASHELKTPITVIESYASLLKRRLKQQPELLEESIEAIHSEAVRMKAMTEQLLLLAKPNRQWKMNWSEFDAVAMAERTAAKFEMAYHREVELKLAQHGAILVTSDEDKLCQLLIILLDNARKYSKASIVMEIGQHDADCYIAVEDRGIGMSAEQLERVFEPFYRVDEARGRDAHEQVSGIGLGLSLAKQITAAIGVKLELKSEVGVGTTATIVIPALSVKSNKAVVQ